MDYLLNPPFRGNLKTPCRSNLKSALQSPLPAGFISAWATGGTGTNNGPQQPGYDQNVSTGPLTGGLCHPGIYAALLAIGPAVTHYLATLTDTNGAFFTLGDLTVGYDPSALPVGILSAKQVTNGLIQDGPDPYGQYAVSGWRIIFDSALILGSQLPFTPSINLVHAELGTIYTGYTQFASHWHYIAANPRLARAGDDTLNWFFDAPLPANLDHWQLQGQASPDPNYHNIATYAAATMTMTDPTIFGLWSFFQLFGCDSAGNQITPTTNIV